MPVTNTSRSQKFLEKQGWIVGIVEQNVNVPKPGGERLNFKRDLFGFGDLLGFLPERKETALIQTTTTANQSSRVQKIITECGVQAELWLECGNKIYVHGWKKLKKTQRWTVTVTAIELDTEFSGLRAREITLDDSPLFSSITTKEREEDDDLDSMELQKPA